MSDARLPDDRRTVSQPPPAVATLHAEVAALSHAGKVRETNEDSFAIFRLGRFLVRVDSNVSERDLPSRHEETGHLMIVADGLGGHAAGEVASKMALVSLQQLILKSPRWGMRFDDPDTRDAEIESLRARTLRYTAGAHASVRAEAARDRQLKGMGTTLTSAYAVGRDMFIVHVGDSRAYILRRGRLIRITHDHTLAQSYADQGLIPQAEVESHQLGHVLTRAVGSGDETPESEMHHVEVEPADRLLLCSDGLSGMVSEAAIAECMGRNLSSEEACRALVALALENGGRDNVTVIVARFEERPGGAA